MVNNQLNPLFYALSDPTRRGFIEQLSQKKRCRISDLTPAVAMSKAAVSKHIRVLEKAQLIQVTQSGRERWCEVSTQTLEAGQDWLKSVKEFWSPSLDALDNYLNKGVHNDPSN